jgi:hypothetical protein
MTSTSSRTPIFLDAAVLAAPTTRSLILFGQLHGDARFIARWSLAAEREADRALIRRAKLRSAHSGRIIPPVLVSALRTTTDLGAGVIVVAAPEAEMTMVDTDPGDCHILAAASACGSWIVVTPDVDDFGRTDLDRLGMIAVNPDLFLSHWMSFAMYRFTLERIAAHRSLPPNTPETIHATLGKAHPLLVRALRGVFPDIEPCPPTDAPPAEIFRGNRCLLCGRTLIAPELLTGGVCPQCATADAG